MQRLRQLQNQWIWLLPRRVGGFYFAGISNIRIDKNMGSIAAHPCKERKDGAPSLEMVRTEMIKPGVTRPDPAPKG